MPAPPAARFVAAAAKLQPLLREMVRAPVLTMLAARFQWRGAESGIQ